MAAGGGSQEVRGPPSLSRFLSLQTNTSFCLPFFLYFLPSFFLVQAIDAASQDPTEQEYLASAPELQASQVRMSAAFELCLPSTTTLQLQHPPTTTTTTSNNRTLFALN
jgi:hypothetical protein